MKLKYRLSFLFLAVIAVGVMTSLFLVRRSTESMFRSLVFTGDAEKAGAYAAMLVEYYRAHGNWDDAQSFLSGFPGLLSRTVDTEIYGVNGWTEAAGYPAATLRSLLADRVVLADANGVIVADTAEAILGTKHPARHLDHGVPVIVDSVRTGTVLVGSMIDSSLTGIDEKFLASITGSLVWSTAASAAIALLLGLLFAARITRPLGALAAAAERVAAGESAAPVPVTGRDEIADLSAVFNEMTTELKRLETAKKQVIADSAHELRTPVTLIQGTIEGMIDGVFPRDTATLESVLEETLRLARLIDTLRELEIIESGELQLALAGVDMNAAIRKAAAQFAPAAGAKTIALEHAAPTGAPAMVKADYLRLGEVLYNLLANAIKFTPEGGSVRIREEAARDGFAAFSVDDSGPGIAPEDRGRVFERFYRTDKSRAAGTGGRGLGLAIASEIVKAHGGSITIGESDLGGARFIVALPRLTEGGA